MLDQLLDLIDSKVTQVYGQLFSIFSDEVDDNFKAVIRFENGVSAMMEIATNCFITQPRWHIDVYKRQPRSYAVSWWKYS